MPRAEAGSIGRLGAAGEEAPLVQRAHDEAADDDRAEDVVAVVHHIAVQEQAHELREPPGAAAEVGRVLQGIRLELQPHALLGLAKRGLGSRAHEADQPQLLRVGRVGELVVHAVLGGPPAQRSPRRALTPEDDPHRSSSMVVVGAFAIVVVLFVVRGRARASESKPLVDKKEQEPAAPEV